MNEQIRLPFAERATQAAEGVPRWKWTTAELLRLAELGAFADEDRFELIGGEIVPMSPKGRRHEVVADEIAQLWSRRAPDDVRIGVERQLNLDDWTYTDPDLLVRPAGIKSYDVRGDTALLVVEISDTTLAKDLGLKAATYARFGVREYWVIDARRLVTRVHRTPLDGNYAEITEHGAEEPLAPLLVPALTLRLADLDVE